MKFVLRIVRWTLSVLMILCAGGLGVMPAAAEVAGPQLTLQQRIDAAADGAIIDVDAGTSMVNLTIHNKSLTLRGSTQAITVLQALDSGLAVISADSAKGLTLENLTITGGHPAGGTGGGIYAAGGSLHLVNCHITHNSAAYGGGIFLDDPASALLFEYGLVDNNAAALDGGGIYAKGSAVIISVGFDSNSADRHGGGLHVQSAITRMHNSVFTKNQALTGNGGAANVNEGLIITSSQFFSNTAAVLGGAISQWNAPASNAISDSIFRGNLASNAVEEVKGGAAYIAGSLVMTDTAFTGNKADTLTSKKNVRGGGLYAGGALRVTGATFTNNQSKCYFCGFNEGGGLYSDLKSGTVQIAHSTFTGNKGWFGAGLCGTNLNVTHSAFLNGGAGSTGGYGGGIDAYSLTGDDLLFQNNSVVNKGGAVDAATAALTHSRFIDNYAGYTGGALSIIGAYSGSNLLFIHNRAYYSGTVVYLAPFAAGSLYNITIAQPTAATGPAVYIDRNAQLNLYNSIVNNYTNAIRLAGTGSKFSEDYNLFYGNTVDVILGSGSIYNPGGHTTGAIPPGFANPAAGNYHLLASSHAIGNGYNYGLTDDLDFHRRLGRNDIGAYQYTLSIFLPWIKR